MPHRVSGRGNAQGADPTKIVGLLCCIRPNAPFQVMIPIHELLNRIRWDRAFAKGWIEVGYFDRVKRRIVFAPLRKLRFPDDVRHVFEIGAAGHRRRIPFHRVREVRIDGRVVWRRPG